MLVFLSWSGPRSKAVAEAFGTWISRVIQAVDPWMSPDIEKGTRWSPEIAGNLEKSTVGLICLTKENLNAPWILFEAGAMSKPRDGHVCTLLLDLRASEIQQPLGQFQHTLARDSDDVFKLVRTINTLVQKVGEKSLPDGLLEEVFKDSWPRLAEKLTAIASQSVPGGRVERPQREILEEILELVRHQERRLDAWSPHRLMGPLAEIARGESARSQEELRLFLDRLAATQEARSQEEMRRFMDRLAATRPDPDTVRQIVERLTGERPTKEPGPDDEGGGAASNA